MERKRPLKRIHLQAPHIQLDSLNLVWALQDRLLPFPIYLPRLLLSRLLFKDFLNLEFRILHNIRRFRKINRMWTWMTSCIMLRQILWVENDARVALAALAANSLRLCILRG
jgi:hypothetical protein